MSNADNYLLVIKSDNKWILHAKGNKSEIENVRNNFLMSIVTETKIVQPKDIKNYGELGWQHDIHLIDK